MISYARIALALLLLTSGLIWAEESPKTTPDGKWNLFWGEEFNTDGMLDPKVWVYEYGLMRNREAQAYTDRKENIQIKNGKLVITGLKEDFQADLPDRKGKLIPVKAKYTAASVSMREGFLYGRLEVRAKIPNGVGTWPAIWLLGTNVKEIGWPKCGEIDVMEYVGKQPNVIHGTLHYFSQNKNKKDSAGKQFDTGSQKVKPYEDFHVYGMEWNEKTIKLFYDDKVYSTLELDKLDPGKESPFRKPFYLKLNLALGGSWGGPVIDDKIFPSVYEIDYVRIYKPAGATPAEEKK